LSPLGSEDELERVRSIYEAYAADARKGAAWAASNPGNQAIRDEVAAYLMPIVGQTPGDVLDAGCGTGWWLARLAAEGVDSGRLHGVDVLPHRVAAATSRTTGVNVRAADVRALPYGDKRFAVVLLFTVLSSLPGASDVSRALREAARVTAPGGFVVIWEPRLPTPNPATRRVRRREVAAVLDGVRSRSMTLFPPVARRLGRATPRLYPHLAGLVLLRSHRLAVWHRPPGRPPQSADRETGCC